MKVIKLLHLKLVNFKGIKEFELPTNGQDLNIYAQNEGGKTTIFDAFTWLLFNKGSKDNQDFGIKTIRNGEVVHNLNHEVEAVLDVDGKEYKLKKVFKEKWTQKKGSATKEFTGHTTKYFSRDVPISKKEYDDLIKEIIGTDQVDSFLKRYKKMKVENVFKLLTVPNFFVDGLHWKERRELLLEITGNISDEEILDSETKFEKLKNALNGNSIEDHKLVIASRKKEINDRLKVIPELINENHLNIPDLNGLDEQKIHKQIDKLSSEIDLKNDRISALKNGDEINDLKKQISNIDYEINNIRNEHAQNEKQEVFKLQARLQEEKSNLSILQGDVKGKMQQKSANDERIKDIERQLVELREQYKESQEQYRLQNELTFDHESNCVCPTCEQDLPEEKIEEAVANFNRNKSNLLEKIQGRIEGLNKKGPELAKKVEEIKKENDVVQADIDKITEQGSKKKEDIEKLEEKIKKAESTVTPIEETQEYKTLVKQKELIEQQIEQLQQLVYESVNGVREEIKSIKEEQAKLQVDLSKVSQAKQIQERINALENEQKDLAEQYESMEHEDYLINEFTNKKVQLIDEKVSKYFEITRFKMFEKQVNGGLDDRCEPTYKGVPFSEGLNDGAKFSVGIDIINVLSKHFGIQAPIFFDNAEQVTKFLVEPVAQMIAMYASEKDKELRVETKPKEESEVA
ncbi:hypothetical protein CAI16_03035 [Virgibacillus dokdonensis]|uniref:Nuclease SbcCD subunit C n=1 Tax=Virgibacillus dokdonensis TaxID=302167 RepID=A0A3E0WY11_9BACI|nr:AAA family ATPase [Virgibacillus dokdonensis]RFA37061.1 hypothetical protein CAI16_03035 [Virgibacillus dokdonensis]